MAKYACQRKPTIITPDPNPTWCTDCERPRTKEDDGLFHCSGCRSLELCPTCKDFQMKGRSHCGPTFEQRWVKRERKEALFYLFIGLPFMTFGFPVLFWISSCALRGFFGGTC